MKKTLLIAAAVTAILTFTAATLIFIQIDKFKSTPFYEKEVPEISFSIKKGESFSSIARRLAENKIISSEIKFKITAKLSGETRKIQSGEYLLSGSMTPLAILNILTNGKIKLYKLTFPEGINLKEIAYILDKNDICSKKDFLEKAYDSGLLKKENIQADSFEGYLFPDTYLFHKKERPEQIIKRMHKKFLSIYSKKFKARAKQIGFSDHQIITLASLIEKETGNIKERGLISSVFHNRLKKGMRLETDVSVIYGIKDFDGNIRKKDLEKLTPYNTYKIKGLPPGPIANPGYDSIKAALFPEKTKFLFFVSKKNGSHFFSKTLKEHNRAVRKYQLRR